MPFRVGASIWFKSLFGLHKCMAGMGCKAQRAASPCYWQAVQRRNRPANTAPKGWSEIGRLDAPPACMGTSPCGYIEASTHPGALNAISKTMQFQCQAVALA